MKKVLLIILLALPLTSLPAYSISFEDGWDFNLRFGGWSKHHGTNKFGDYNFNESHSGLGIQSWKSIKQSNWKLGAELFHMKDSFGKNAQMYSLAAKYEYKLQNKILTDIGVMAGATIHDRSFMRTYYYKENESIVIKERDYFRDVVVAPSLILTVRLGSRVDIDFMHIPDILSNMHAVSFIRLGLKL